MLHRWVQQVKKNRHDTARLWRKHLLDLFVAYNETYDRKDDRQLTMAMSPGLQVAASFVALALPIPEELEGWELESEMVTS